MMNDNDSGESEEGDQAEDQESLDERAEEILERDNQVRHALQLLKSWSLFSQIQTKP